MSRADGQAPEEAFFKAAISKWSQHRDTIPAPWHSAAIDLDVAFMEARLRFQRIAPDPAPALAARWGVARTTAWRRTRHMLAGHETPRNDAQPAATAEPVVAHVLAVECNTDATACNQGATEAATMSPVALFSAPVEGEQEGDKNTIKPAKAGGVSLDDIQSMLDEMHAIAKAVDPSARRQGAKGLAPAVMRTLKFLAPTARATNTTTRAIIIELWRWWWSDDNKWLRERRPGAKSYTTMFRPCNVETYLVDSDNWRAARYIPTADEALDAVLEVGCAAAEQRYPAGAKAIRQTFDYAMGGDLARMRSPKDPAKMRSAWASGLTKYLNAPALALVSR